MRFAHALTISIVLVFAGLPVLAQTPRTILILTSSFGGGHDSVAAAVAAMIKQHNPKARIIAQNKPINPKDPITPHRRYSDDEVIALLSDQTSDFNVVIKDYGDFIPFNLREKMQTGYETLTRISPWTWDQMYKFSMWQARNYESAAKLTNPIKRTSFLEYLRAIHPDTVISSFFYATATLDAFREKGLISEKDFKYLWVHTDNVDDNFFKIISKQADMTALPAKPFETAWVDSGIPKEKVTTTGMPVNPIFFEAFTDGDREKFRKSIGFEEGVPMVTIAGGSAGVGDYPLMVKSLVAAANGPIQIVAICANNEKNFKELTSLKSKLPQHVKLIIEKKLAGPGFIKLVNYIRSSDGYIVKSGGLSSAESAVIGASSKVATGGPVTILLDIMGGPERGNSRFFTEQGLALVTRDQSRVGQMMFGTLKNQIARANIRAAQIDFSRNISMRPIEDFIFGGGVNCAEAANF